MFWFDISLNKSGLKDEVVLRNVVGTTDGFDIDFGYQGTITNALNIGRPQADGLDASFYRVVVNFE